MRDVFPVRRARFGTIALAIDLLSAAVAGAGCSQPGPTSENRSVIEELVEGV